MIAPDHLEAQATAAREKARKLRRAAPIAARAWESVSDHCGSLAWALENAAKLERQGR